MVKSNLIKIYTKTGDKGETGLYGGKRILKSSLRIEAIGTIDEFNSAIGVVIAEIQSSPKRPPQGKVQNYRSKLKNELEKIPHDLYDIGALLATPSNTQVAKGQAIHQKLPAHLSKRTKEFEIYIDSLTEKLSLLKDFVSPSGGKIGALLHFSRTICRRAERRVIELNKKEKVHPEILIYLNRLSDVLFTMARYANLKDKHKEVLWDKRGST